MSFVQTVLGKIDPDKLGVTYSHEHIIIEKSFPTVSHADFILNDVDRVSKELMDFYHAGGRTVIDTMPANSGRNVLKLAQVSRNSNVNIIAPTGIHLEMYYLPDHWRYHLSEEELTQLFIDDIVHGIDEFDYGCPLVKRTPHKAGLIKLATGDEPITAHQEKIFHAVVNAHRQTGAPILTHTNGGKHAMEQVILFDKLGADLSHVVISHVDKNGDAGYHRALMQAGVYLEYDSHFRWKTGEVNKTYALLEQLLPDFGNQIVAGMDMARNTYWRSYGGEPGLIYLLTTFKERLSALGLQSFFEKIFISNPKQLFCFRPAFGT